MYPWWLFVWILSLFNFSVRENNPLPTVHQFPSERVINKQLSKEEIAHCLLRAQILRDSIQLDSAVSILEKVLIHTSRQKDPSLHLDCLEQLTLSYLLLENEVLAMKYALEGLSFFSSPSNKEISLRAKWLTLTGKAFYIKGEFKTAATYFEQAYKLYDGITSSPTEQKVELLRYSGSCYSYFYLYPEEEKEYRILAKKKLESAQSLALSLDGKFLDDVYNSLGWYYLRISDFPKARQYHHMALLMRLKRQQTKANRLKTAQSYNAVAAVWGSMLNSDSLIYYHRKSYQVRSSIWKHHPDLSISANSLASAFARKALYDTALYYAQRSLIACSGVFDDPDFRKNPDESSIILTPQLVTALLHKSKILWERYQGQSHDIRDLKIAYNCILLFYKQISKVDRKLKFNLENNFQINDVDITHLLTCETLFHLTGDRKYFYSCIDMLELTRANNLRKSLYSATMLMEEGLDSIEINHIKSFEYQIDEKQACLSAATTTERKMTYKGQYDSLMIQYNEYMEQLAIKHPGILNFGNKMVFTSAMEFSNILPSGKAVLAYSVYDTIIFGFAFTNGKEVMFHRIIRPADHQIFTDFTSLRTEFGKAGQNKTEFYRWGRSLYQWLIRPLEPLVDHSTEIYILSEKELSGIPFEILLTTNIDPNSTSYREFPFFIKKHPVSYSFSITLMKLRSGLKSLNNDSLIAFAPLYENISRPELNGNKDYMTYRDQILPLPGSKKEITGLAGIVPSRLYFGQEAGITNFIKNAGRYRMVHIAAHSFLNREEPLNSAIAFYLNPREQGAGFLHGFEINRLKLKAEMVVLSACNTGTGKWRPEEGVNSLGWYFANAGIPSQVITLWNVEDQSSAKIMSSFYQFLKKGDSKPEALRNAKLRFLEESPERCTEPFLWAGFILYGDPLPLFPGSNIRWMTALSSLLLLILLILLLKKNAAY